MKSLLNRIRRIERRRIKTQSNRTLMFSAADRAEGRTSDFSRYWLCGHNPYGKNTTAGRKLPLAGGFMVCPDFGSASDWEKALEKQQAKLITEAKLQTLNEIE